MRLRLLAFLPGKAELRALLLYVAAGALYVGIGVAWPDFLLAWYTAAGYLAVVVVLVPAIVRRLR
jgi:hypothetical protein